VGERPESESAEFDAQVKLAIYRHFAATGRSPEPSDTARAVNAGADTVLEAYQRLRANRVLLPDESGTAIQMAPPFSGVPTQHVVESDGVRYFANCAWDAFGIPAALKTRSARVVSRCEESLEVLDLRIGRRGPELEAVPDWVFHCLVPAVHWWDDLPFT